MVEYVGSTGTVSIGSGKDYSTISAWIASLSDGTYSSGDDIIGELYDSSYDEAQNSTWATKMSSGLMKKSGMILNN